MKIIFQFVLTVMVFSIYVVFALLIINPFYSDDLAGYQVGRICIWDFLAFLISAIIAFSIIRKWGYGGIEMVDDEVRLVMSPKYGYFFFVYLLLAIIIASWQFYLFSQRF